MTKWTTENGVIADKYKEKETTMRIDEITNSTEKLELLRMIDAAIWQAFDAESAYGDYDDDSENVGQGVAATPTANQVVSKSAAIQKPTTPVKKLTQQQQAHVKTLGPKELLSYIKTNLKAPAPVPTKATPKPVANINPNPNNNKQSNSSFDTVNAKVDAAKYKNAESDR
jgi:hypothetical protein